MECVARWPEACTLHERCGWRTWPDVVRSSASSWARRLRATSAKVGGRCVDSCVAATSCVAMASFVVGAGGRLTKIADHMNEYIKVKVAVA